MRHRSARTLAGLGLTVVAAAALAFNFQESQPASKNGRFSFTVIESFDAKYLGDTPGHRGRNGGLGEQRPHIALGDPIHRGDKIVGQVTSIAWDRVRSSLEIEFDPAPLARISVGDEVWLNLADPAK